MGFTTLASAAVLSLSHLATATPRHVEALTQNKARDNHHRRPNIHGLSQEYTNGHSPWGTHHAPHLPQFVDGPMSSHFGTPWGGRNSSNCNPYAPEEIPDTGVTRYYDWHVQNTTMAPDGVDQVMLVVNGQFPGPLIEANWGDWIEVKVTNDLPFEGTSLHWHGFLQKGTPYYDGVPGISQCPIAPGKVFTYRFRAELYGTSWWHSHFSAQYVNGLSGPIVVHGPVAEDAEYDIDLGPVMLTDWFHDYYYDLIQQAFFSTEAGPILPPMAQNMLINGKAPYNCSNTNLTCAEGAPYAQFNFQSGKKHLMRLVNHGNEAVIFFSIDGYDMTVVANDFVPVKPYVTDLITLGVGQRSDIIVEGKGDGDDAVWMRMSEGPSGLGPAGHTGCSLNDGNQFEVTAAIYYENADRSFLPNTTTSVNETRYLFPTNCGNPDLLLAEPAFPMTPGEPDVTIDITMTGHQNETGAFTWYMNNQTFRADYNDPTLLEAKLGNFDFDPLRAVYNMGTNSSVRFNFTSVGFPASHPMHIHGHNMYVLAEGVGQWNGTIVNPQNPQRRDTQLIRPNGYLVVQIDLDNPGVWPLHCHVAWHISEGMNINIMEQVPDIMSSMKMPMNVAQTCRDWSAFSEVNVVDQIDSGL